MLLLVLQVSLLAAGLVAVITGRLKVTGTRSAAGLPARVIGVIGLVPIPLNLAIGFLVGLDASANGAGGMPTWLWQAELGVTVGCAVLMFAAAATVSRPSERGRAGETQ